jgi:hypothetical protein
MTPEMNADQIAEIRPALREAIDGAPDTCVTFTVAGAPEKWLQVLGSTINTAYPHEGDPEEWLHSLPRISPQIEVEACQPGLFATFQFPAIEITPTARWIDGWFVQVLGCLPGEYHLDIQCERM